MSGIRGVWALGIVLVSWLAGATDASAFCGFYVGSAEGLTNGATMVVLMREGNRTVLSMQNDYRGPVADFAMVVPVPIVLQRENVKTLPREVFERVDRLASPRLVEYWERDPCAANEGTIGLGNLGTIGFGGGGGSGSGYGRGAAVVVEAQFTVGEYDIVILSAREANALDAWLREHNYRIPDGAAEILRPYVEAGTKFFVAKVDARRVRFQGGRAVLSPLRMHYDSETFELPVRLGLLSSGGTQDLVVHILGLGQRYELANYGNVFIPTNLDVDPAARSTFPQFYAALFDRTIQENPGAVVTEYAWQTSGCDPCPGPVLTNDDLATLGADVAFPNQMGGGGFTGAGATVPQVRMGNMTVTGPLSREVIRRITRRHINEIRFCYEQELARTPTLAGTVILAATITPPGSITQRPTATGLASPGAMNCMTGALQRWTFPSGDQPTQVQIPITLTLSGSGPLRPSFGGGMGMGGGPLDQMVLTRLHYRYGRDALGRDLVFRAAPPIAGGREGWNGPPEQGANPSDLNNFQARYAIRHEWAGPIECATPRRGVWGGPPQPLLGNANPTAPAAAATNLGSVARTNVDLTTMIRSPIPGRPGTTPTPTKAPSPRTPDPATDPATPTAPPTVPPTPPAARSDPGCSTTQAPLSAAPGILLVLTALVASRRARTGRTRGSRATPPG